MNPLGVGAGRYWRRRAAAKHLMMAILLIIAWVFLKPKQVQILQENRTGEIA